MRVVYFLTSYQSQGPVLRLIRTLRQGDPSGQIVLHHDIHSTPVDEQALADLGVTLFTSDHPIVWGDMTLEAMRWRVYRWILQELDFDWVVLLSEQDYPIAPLSKLKAHLAEGGWDAVIASSDLGEETTRRYGYTYANLPQLGIERRLPARVGDVARRVRSKLYNAIDRVQSRVFLYSFPAALGLPSKIGIRRRSVGYRADFPAHAVSAWFALSRRALERVVSFIDADPGYRRYAERTVIPLESATGSIVYNDPALLIRNASLHYVRFSDPTSGRPDELGADDFDELVGSGCFFARKFAIADQRILDQLDQHVLASEDEC